MTSKPDRFSAQRREKLAKIRGRGINPYPNTYHRSHTAQEAVAVLKQSEEARRAKEPAEITVRGLVEDGAPSVSIGGRIMARRGMGKISFLDLRDGSGKIQLLFGDALNPGLVELSKDIDIGDIIGATGRVFRTRTGEPTVAVSEFSLLSKSLEPLPEKWHGLADVDLRYRQRYLDLISNPEVKETFEARCKAVAAVRHFMNQRGFMEVETPVLQPSAGGALAKPFITHHNALDQDFFLRIALELHLKRLIVGGFDKVYEIGRIFRNEGIDASHSPEFTMLESYEAYADYNDVMKMVEEMVSEVCMKVHGTTEIKFGEHAIDLKTPWRRITLRDAVKEYGGIDFVAHPTADGLREKMRSMSIEADPKQNWAKLVDELLSTCVKPKIIQPTFLIDYPVSMSPLAKTKPGEERVVERFQAFVAGQLEIANAYTELNDPLEQRERFVKQLKERTAEGEERWTIDEDFLTALEYGMPPTGGLGVGVDRLVMLLTNQSTIREVILFPTLKEKAL
ncbi:MAG: lysine--tRNA ligase [Chloroflexi bacterium RBG_16_57_8]|nr:MAG: lysine--tRNA ligase [Chloroflexi bacterium RBG_16_57_8]